MFDTHPTRNFPLQVSRYLPRSGVHPKPSNDVSGFDAGSIILYCDRCDREGWGKVAWLNAYLVGGFAHIVCGRCEADLTFDIFPPPGTRA